MIELLTFQYSHFLSISPYGKLMCMAFLKWSSAIDNDDVKMFFVFYFPQIYINLLNQFF